MDPLITCCIITYNHKNYIAQAIESVLTQQHYYSFEIIIADDYSTDGTITIIKEYEQKYPTIIKTLKRQKNIGAAKNFIELLQAAKGKYIAYLEGDDYWCDNNKIQKQVSFLEANPDYVLCHSNVLEVFSEDVNDSRNYLHASENKKATTGLNDILYANYVQTASIVFKNKLFNYFPEWYAALMPGDWPLHILNAQYGKMFYMSDCMCVHRNHATGTWTTQKSITQINNLLHVIEVLSLELGLKNNKYLKAGKSNLLLSSIKYLFKEKKYLLAIKNCFKAFFVHPSVFLLKKN